MIEPTEADIGRRVYYEPDNNGPIDHGVITSFNEHFVFVRYDKSGDTPEGTSRSVLFWG